MDIPDHFMTCIPCDPLNAFPDNGRAEMSYMKRLGYVRTAVIDNDLRRMLRHFQSKFRLCLHFIQIFLYKALL